jgi:hypothetical protein
MDYNGISPLGYNRIINAVGYHLIIMISPQHITIDGLIIQYTHLLYFKYAPYIRHLLSGPPYVTSQAISETLQAGEIQAAEARGPQT